MGTTERCLIAALALACPLFRGSAITVLWTPLSKLPPELAERLRNGGNPWKVGREESGGVRATGPDDVEFLPGMARE